MLPSAAPLSDWLARLETLSPKEIDLGLERVQTVRDRLHLEMPETVLLVAGTNGKGSSVAMTAALLGASGKRVGAYTSPHIHRFNERIVVNGQEASDTDIVAAFETVEAARGDTRLTYFEYGTLAAAVVFAAAEVDVWILEIGLGGRLDASNAFEPSASLITNVALDHCEWLGNDIEAIAVEKAGVMRAARPCVYGGESMPASMERHATAIGAICFRADRDFQRSVVVDGCWDWRGPSRSLTALRLPGLLGDFQIDNAAAVLALLDAAGLMQDIDAALINSVLPNLTLTGRSELLFAKGRLWWIDVAHNPAAATVLAASLSKQNNGEKTVAVIGMLNDKDVAGIIGPIAKHIDRWIAIAPAHGRAISENELARQISNETGSACLVAGSVAQAVDFAERSASENDRILVTGSFFTVGPVLDCLATDSRPKTKWKEH